VGDGMARFVFRNCGVDRVTESLVAKLCELSRVYGGFIIGVDNVARGASARTKVSGMVIGAKKIKCGVKQPRFVQSNKHRVGAVAGAESSFTKSNSWAPGFLEHVGDSDLGYCGATSFEDSQDVSGLSDLKTWQGFQERQHSLLNDFVLRRRRDSKDPLRYTVFAVTFSVARVFNFNGTVVVQGRSPQHATVRHHALLDL